MTPLQPHGTAPYTSAIAITTILDAYRDRGLGTPVTAAVVTRAGVAESLANRTVNSLKALSLIDEQGHPTEQFEDFRRIRGQEEYEARLQEWLRGVYADVLQYTDPSADSPAKVAEAFRTYEPAGRRVPMAALLIGLWRYAGLPVADAGAPARQSSRSAGRPSTTKKPASPNGRSAPRGGRPQVDADHAVGGLPPALVGMLKQIPTDGRGWTEAKRKAFLEAFEAVLDFTVPVGAPALDGSDDVEVSTP